VWAGSFDETDANIFRLQDSISQQVAGALFRDLSINERAILSKQKTKNPEAYACYLKGNYFWSKRGNESAKALDYFRCAVELDPSFAEAYVGLAAVDAASIPIPSPEAEALIERALQLDGSLAEAHATKGLIKMFHHWDWAEAETELDRAIELNPNSVSAHHWKGVYFSLRGRLDEAKAEMHRALELDPLSLIVMADLGQVHYFAHEYDQALDYCNRALAMDSTFQISHEYLFDIYREKGMEREALNQLAQFELPGAPPESVARLRDIYLTAGFQNTLRRHIEGYLRGGANEQKISAIRIGQYYIQLGNYEQALDWLEITPDKPNFLVPFMNVDPIYDPVRSDPRFQYLLERMNLKQSK
jgi:tetratricopeptide (TPR) repeat protein